MSESDQRWLETVNPSSGAYWLEVSSNGRFCSGVLSWCDTLSVNTCLSQWFGYYCRENLLLGTCLEVVLGKVGPGNASPPMLALVQRLKFKALDRCGSESSQLTHHRASKSFPPRERRQPAQCVFMLCSVYVSFPRQQSFRSRAHPIDLILHRQGPYFQIKSHQEELGVKISPREFGWLQRHRDSCHREVEGNENGERT